MHVRPSKKIVPILVACLIAVGAVVFASEYPEIKDKQNSQKTKNSVLEGEIISTKKNSPQNFKQIINVDENSDNVKNWEETLSAIHKPSENLSETEKFGRELFAKYVDGKKSGTLDQESFIKEILESEVSAGISKKFTTKDIVIIPNTTLAGDALEKSIKAYGNAVGFIFANSSTGSSESELDILNRALNTEKPEELKKIDPIISGYQKIVDSLKSVPAPEDISLAHLDLLNSVQSTLDDMRGFRKIFDDPIPGLLSLKKYMVSVESMKQSLNRITSTFIDKNVVFTQSEYGYVLVRTI